jgi:hypothetical protein
MWFMTASSCGSSWQTAAAGSLARCQRRADLVTAMAWTLPVVSV